MSKLLAKQVSKMAEKNMAKDARMLSKSHLEGQPLSAIREGLVTEGHHPDAVAKMTRKQAEGHFHEAVHKAYSSEARAEYELLARKDLKRKATFAVAGGVGGAAVGVHEKNKQSKKNKRKKRKK